MPLTPDPESYFFMPVVAPPAAGYDPVRDAGLVRAGLNPDGSLAVQVSDPARADLYAMAPGSVWFVPGGKELPTFGRELSPGEGTIVLLVDPAMVLQLEKTMATGLRPATQILYMRVKAETVLAAMRSLVEEAGDTEFRVLYRQATGVDPPPGASRDDLTGDIVEAAMAGGVKLYAKGGALLGKAALADGAAAGGPAEFALRFLDGSDPRQDLAPASCLRVFASQGGERWRGHPLLQAISDTIPRPVDVCVRFEAYNVTNRRYDSVGAATVEMRNDRNGALLASGTTSGEGVVEFHLGNIEAMETPEDREPDLYFVVRPAAGTRIDDRDLPAKWSTKGWQAVDGLPGLLERFAGVQIGFPDRPVVFRVGLDIHVAFNYILREDRENPRKAPPKIPVEVEVGDATYDGFTTDPNGELHAGFLNVNAGDDVSFRLPLETTDDAIHLPRSVTDFLPWDTCGEDNGYFPDHAAPCIGSLEEPAVVRADDDESNVGLFWLMTLREFQMFLFHMIGGDQWDGIEGLRMETAIVGRSSAWQRGTVDFTREDCWSRNVIFHELGHQVMWKAFDYSTPGILWAGISQYATKHTARMVVNPQHAFWEGWPEFLQMALGNLDAVPFLAGAAGQTALNPFLPPDDTVVDDNEHLAGRLWDTPNRGESIEGAVATALLRIFRRFVVAPDGDAVQLCRMSDNGNIVNDRTQWLLNQEVQNRFRDLIWSPFYEMHQLPTEQQTSTTFLRKIASRPNYEDRWHRIRAELNALNTAREPPTIEGIEPASTLPRISYPVRIRGTRFVEITEEAKTHNLPYTRVEIGGREATVDAVRNHSVIELLTPEDLEIGDYDVTVTTPGGTAVLERGFHVVRS